ncbi:MAG: hypothetical protein JW969_20610, partial [Spirochaetales bacterium]|nr:hypothetical protein [Spirochaetales bacterium]
WEIISCMDKPLICAVNKYDRFLAAKTAMETLMTSGVKLDHAAYPNNPDPEKDLLSTARKLYAGLQRQMRTKYGLKQQNGLFTPKTAEEIKAEVAATFNP